MAAVSKNVAEQLAKSAKSSATTSTTASTSQPSIYSAQYNVAAVSKTDAASTPAGNHSSRLYQHQQQQQQFHSTFNDIYSKSNGNYRLYTNFC